MGVEQRPHQSYAAAFLHGQPPPLHQLQEDPRSLPIPFRLQPIDDVLDLPRSRFAPLDVAFQLFHSQFMLNLRCSSLSSRRS
ncbi:hypothetical protein NZK33_17140 [Cyanobium sp. FGCU-6]|jgi:hypothetical protein|nr:hypothetical protein [Cyanobium sp. FGCU6]